MITAEATGPAATPEIATAELATAELAEDEVAEDALDRPDTAGMLRGPVWGELVEDALVVGVDRSVVLGATGPGTGW